jgi:hypothetical protein
MRGGHAQLEGEIRGEVAVGKPSHAVRAEQPTHHVLLTF